MFVKRSFPQLVFLNVWLSGCPGSNRDSHSPRECMLTNYTTPRLFRLGKRFDAFGAGQNPLAGIGLVVFMLGILGH